MEVRGVKFEKSEEWSFVLPARSLITPVYFRGRIVRLLVTNATTGKATYHEVEARPKELVIPACYVYSLPQGITYRPNTDVRVHILYSTVSIYNYKPTAQG